MRMTLKTLTPIWTGGVDTGKMDRIHETGIVGSLRWWYEAIVRGLGGLVCAPGQSACSNDVEKYRKSKLIDERERLREAGLCDVCQVFGATGWKRRFRLEVLEDLTQPAWQPADKMLNIRPPGRTRGWYLPPGRMGSFSLLFHGDPQTLSQLAALFLFLEKWGNLGPKPQLGYGVFAIANRDAIKPYALKWHPGPTDGKKVNNSVPDLRRFGCVRYQFQPTGVTWWTRIPGLERVAIQVQPLVVQHKIVPVAPVLKNEWRFNRWQGRREDEIKMFGSLWPERIRSKVAVSWAYAQNGGWEVRGWMWLPGLPKKPHVAAQVWDIVSNESTWQRVIGVPGKLILAPKKEWQELDVNRCIQFLQEALND